MSTDPSSGTVPTGYVIVRPDQGWVVKRHAGAYAWETVLGASGGKLGFYGVTPVVQPSGGDQAAVTLGNSDGEIAGLTISDPATQAEVQALRDKTEELADDVRALSQPVHALRGALVNVGVFGRVDSRQNLTEASSVNQVALALIRILLSHPNRQCYSPPRHVRFRVRSVWTAGSCSDRQGPRAA